MSKPMGAKITAIPTTHIAILARPDVVADVIVVAAKATASAGWKGRSWMPPLFPALGTRRQHVAGSFVPAMACQRKHSVASTGRRGVDRAQFDARRQKVTERALASSMGTPQPGALIHT
jgi:hypothetical protein